MKAMKRVMAYVLKTAMRGILLKPNAKWDGKDKNFVFVVSGQSDSEFAKCPMTRKSVSGWATSLCGAPVTKKSKQQDIVAISVTEAEVNAACSCAQDMVYEYHLLKSIGLKVQIPMILEIDNKGAVDLINNWSVSGRTRHMDIRLHFMRDLKERKIIRYQWVSNKHMDSDQFTKNLGAKDIDKQGRRFFGDDQYMGMTDSQGEGVGGG